MSLVSLPSDNSKLINEIFDLLFTHFGPQKWWPGETPFEICVGAILTQNTSWSNVEKAIANLKNAEVLDFESMRALETAKLADLIRPAGYFNIKAKRLKSFLDGIALRFGAFENLQKIKTENLREELLAINGIGPETADSIVLYAFNRSSFVIDAYTKRILVRHRLMDAEADYYRMKEFFEHHLEINVTLFNEYHALIVMTGKKYCSKSKPKCDICPLNKINGGPQI